MSVKKEIEAPDLWKEFNNYQASFSLEPSVEIVNENIPYNEVKKITEAVKYLKDELIMNFELNDTQQHNLNSKMDYLIEQSKSQPRRNWVYICIGLMLNIAWDLALEPEKRQIFMNLFQTFLGQFIFLIPQQLE
ncbi:hypothetical protein ACFL6P_07090 [Candidatus Latescibacterota bacterium]